MKARLIICDDHRLVAESIATALRRKGYAIAGVVFSGDELLRLLNDTTGAADADCLLLDLSMPGRNGLEVLPLVRQLAPTLRILVVTMHLDRALANRVLHQGAKAYIVKDSTHKEFDIAIRTVLDGGSYVSPRLPEEKPRDELWLRSHQDFLLLTPQEQKVLLLMGEGSRPTEIARELALRPSTITYHIKHILRTLGLASRAALAR